MFRKERIVFLVCMVVLATALVGCPTTPKLSVSPTTLNFGSTLTEKSFAISNSGGGTLTWQIVAKPDWLTLSVDEGTTVDQSQLVKCTADRTGLTESQAGVITVVAANGAGMREIIVMLTVIPPPILSVSPAAIDFGGSQTISQFTVQNTGRGTLNWSVSTPLPQGVTAQPMSGNLVSDQSATVTVMLDRTGLEPGTTTNPINLTSNGGDGTCMVSATIQSVTLSPLTLSFGPLFNELPFTLSNAGDTAWDYIIAADDLPSWATIDVGDLTGTVPAEGQKDIVVTVDRSGLAPGAYEDTVSIACDGGTNVLTLTIQGPEPELFVSPTSLDFGASDDTDTFTVGNIGTGTLVWTVEEGTLNGAVFTASDVAWLSVDILGGNNGPSSSTTVTATVDRSQSTPDPDETYEAVLRVTSETQVAYVTVSQRTLPPTLNTLPRPPIPLDFMTTHAWKNLLIWNDGVGVANWEIDASDKPDWLTVEPVSAGIASGSVAGDETDFVAFLVDRTDLAPTAKGYTWTFDVTATDGDGAPLEPVHITISMNVAEVPTILIDTGTNPDGVPYVDEDEIPFMPFGTTLETRTFTIYNQGVAPNQGTAPLSWSINAASLPSWITSVSPLSDTISPQGMQVVTVEVDRSNLSFGNESFTIGVESNDPDRPVAPVRVELQVPKRVIIEARPGEVAMGPYGVSDTFEVANVGDAGSLLNFQIESNKPWVYVYPETGASEGTADIVKDWQEIGVSIDRTQLESTGGTAILTITAYETNELGQRVVLTNVAPETVTVSVEAADLSFEAARAITRVPSVVRYVTLMRDIHYLPIPLGIDIIDDYVNGFTIFEDSVQLERSETSQFLTPGANLRTDVVLLLDYSGSMYQAAAGVPEFADEDDPLQTLYEQYVGDLIDGLPDFYSIALLEFHERNQPVRLVTAPDNGAPFISDKTLLKNRLSSISIKDHGATEFLPALIEAADKIAFRAGHVLVDPQNQSEVQAIICITDGRMTTPPGRIKDAYDYLTELRVRFFPIGWGDVVAHEPLARIAGRTGGHYYPTRPDTGVADLADWVNADDETLPCDKSVAKDLRSQVVLSYVTLREMVPVTLRLDGAFDNPNDGEDAPCPSEDQGVISGSMTQKSHDLFSNRGDIRLGHVSLRTDGLQDGDATVIVRLDYMPRNVEQIEFQFATAQLFSIEKISKLDGGAMEDWTLESLGGGHYRLTPPVDGDVLPYGAFGDLLRLTFEDVAVASFNLGFSIPYPVYNANTPEKKYFTCPDTLVIDADGAEAPAGPTPLITVTNPASDAGVIDFGDTLTQATLSIRNRGGSHTPTGVWLNWFAAPPDIGLTILPSLGSVANNWEADIVTVTLSRSLPAGVHVGTLTFAFTTGTPQTNGPEIPFSNDIITAEIPYTVTILEPVLEVTSDSFDPDTTTLDFGVSEDPLFIQLRNAGQSTLQWQVIASELPPWLTVSPASGDILQNTTSIVSIDVSHDDLLSGSYNHSFQIISNGGIETVTVEITVP